MVATKGEEAREAKSGERGVGVTREVSVIGVAKELAEDRDGPFPECDGDLASCQHVHDVIGCGSLRNPCPHTLRGSYPNRVFG